jgi:hypothetical protein
MIHLTPFDTSHTKSTESVSTRKSTIASYAIITTRTTYIKRMTSTTSTTTPETTTTTTTTKYYVSITGIKLKSIWHFPKFQSYSGPSMKQSQKADGNISSQGNYRNGVLHTLSVWKDRKSMARFMASGAHARAMKINDEVSVSSTTKVYGYETDTIPTWDEAILLWDEHGTRHGVKPNKNNKQQQQQEVGKPSSSSNFHQPRYWFTLTACLLFAYTACLWTTVDPLAISL